MAEKVMVVAPHPDDESIGCGGTICLHRQSGDEVGVVFLTSGERGLSGVSDETARAIREAEAEEAGKVLTVDEIHFLRLPDLGLSENVGPGGQALGRVVAERAPSVIYLPHPHESHPDHESALPIVLAALKQLPDQARLPELFGYEVWSPMCRYGWVEDISGVIQRKLTAVRCHRSQLNSLRYDRAIQALNRYRGMLAAGSCYAEAFQYIPTNVTRARSGA